MRAAWLALALAACRTPVPIATPDLATVVDLATPRPATFAVTFDGKTVKLSPAHSREEFVRRRDELRAAMTPLSAEERTRVEARLDLIADVSIAEGGFEGVATRPRDPMASLGIFQWAGARKDAIEVDSSLARFFVALHARAHCEHCVAADAWAECAHAGLSIDHGVVELQHAPAIGAAIEAALAPVFGRPAMRAYQLLAACDWIDHVASQRVGASTVGALMRSPRALATAVLLGVNRPAWVVPSLTEATANARDESSLVDAFRTAALSRYAPHERTARAMRLLTSEVVVER